MLVSPTTVSVPLIAPSVNVQTEQVARDNRVKAPIAPAVAMAKSQSERRVSSDEKQRKSAYWDPSEHPDYDTEQDEFDVDLESPVQVLDRLFALLSLHTYSEHQGKGYVMRFKLPKRILAAALGEEVMVKRRNVIRYHYGHAVAPNTPSDVIAVL